MHQHILDSVINLNSIAIKSTILLKQPGSHASTWLQIRGFYYCFFNRSSIEELLSRYEGYSLIFTDGLQCLKTVAVEDLYIRNNIISIEALCMGSTSCIGSVY